MGVSVQCTHCVLRISQSVMELNFEFICGNRAFNQNRSSLVTSPFRIYQDGDHAKNGSKK